MISTSSSFQFNLAKANIPVRRKLDVSDVERYIARSGKNNISCFTAETKLKEPELSEWLTDKECSERMS